METNQKTQPKTLGNRLEAIMKQLYNGSQWGKLLGISSTAIKYWFDDESAPSLDNLVSVRQIIHDSGNSQLKKEFEQLCSEPLIFLTKNYKKFKADNLYEFLARNSKSRIVSNLNVAPVKSEEKEHFYDQVARYVYLSSQLAEDDRKTLEELMEKLNAILRTKRGKGERLSLIRDAIEGKPKKPAAQTVPETFSRSIFNWSPALQDRKQPMEKMKATLTKVG